MPPDGFINGALAAEAEQPATSTAAPAAAPPDPYNIQGALKAGYDVSEIVDYLGRNGVNVAGARKAGYLDDEIVSHLIGRAPEPEPEPPAKPAEPVSSTWHGISNAIGQDVIGLGGKALEFGGDIDKGLGAAAQAGARNAADVPRLQLDIIDKIDNGEPFKAQPADLGSRTQMLNGFGLAYAASDAQTRARIRDKITAQAAVKPEDTLLSKAGSGLTALGGAIHGGGEAVTEFGERQFPLTDEEQQRWTVRGIHIATGLAPYIVAAAGGLPALAAVAGFQGYGNAFEEAKKAGASDEDAAIAGVLGGAVDSALVAVPLHTAMNVLAKVPSQLKGEFVKTVIDMGKASATGVTFVQMQTVADNLVAKATYDADRPVTQNVGKDIGLQAAVFALLPFAPYGAKVAGRAAKGLLNRVLPEGPTIQPRGGEAPPEPPPQAGLGGTPPPEPPPAGPADVMAAPDLDSAIKTAEAASSAPVADASYDEPPQAEPASTSTALVTQPTPVDVRSEVDQLSTGSSRDLAQASLLRLFANTGRGTVEQNQDGSYQFRTTNEAGDEVTHPIAVYYPSPAAQTAPGPDQRTPVTTEQADVIRQHYGQAGVNVVFYQDHQAIPFDGAVDPNQPNTIFLSSNPQRALVQVAGHEFGHVLTNTTLPDGTSLGDLLHQQIAVGLTNAGQKHAERMFGWAAPKRADFANDADWATAVQAHLVNEMGAEIAGEAPKFSSFAGRVIDAVQARWGDGVAADMLRKLMDGLRAAMQSIREMFGGTNTRSRNWVSNIEDVHDTLAKMYAERFGSPLERERAAHETAVDKVERDALVQSSEAPENGAAADQTLNPSINVQSSEAPETAGASGALTVPPEAGAAPAKPKKGQIPAAMGGLTATSRGDGFSQADEVEQLNQRVAARPPPPPHPDRSPEAVAAVQAIADRWEHELGNPGMARAIRAGLGLPPRPNDPPDASVAFQQGLLDREIAKRGGTAPKPQETFSMDQFMSFKGDTWTRFKAVATDEARELLNAAEAAAQKQTDRINALGWSTEEIGQGSPPAAVKDLKDTLTTLWALSSRFVAGEVASVRGYKRANPEGFSALTGELRRVIDRINGASRPDVASWEDVRDGLHSNARQQRRWLDELATERDAAAKATPQARLLQQTEAAILRPVDGNEADLPPAARDRLEQVRAKIDEVTHPEADTPPMAKVRGKLAKTSEALVQHESAAPAESTPSPESKPKQPRAEQTRPSPESGAEQPQPERPSNYGANNKTFTKERADKARETLRAKFARLSSGFDPELMAAGFELAGFHIEAGARKFREYARRMIEDIGAGARPYLAHFYNSVRDFPGFDNKGMDDAATVKRQHEAPRQAVTIFRSGANAPADFRGYVEAGVPVGVSLAKMSPNSATNQLLLDYARKGGQVFIDSGAFTAFTRGTPVDFAQVLERQLDLARQADGARLHFVMPDVIGDQAESLRLIAAHADSIKELIALGQDVMVPLQKGDMSPRELFAAVRQVLGTSDFTAAIPFNKVPFSHDDLRDLFAGGDGPQRVHLLGIAGRQKALEAAVAVIREAGGPDVAISADASRINAGVGEGRAITEGQKQNLTRLLEDLWGGQKGLEAVDETELMGDLASTPDFLTPEQARDLAESLGVPASDHDSWVDAAHDGTLGELLDQQDGDGRATMDWLRQQYQAIAEKTAKGRARTDAVKQHDVATMSGSQSLVPVKSEQPKARAPAVRRETSPYLPVPKAPLRLAAFLQQKTVRNAGTIHETVTPGGIKDVGGDIAAMLGSRNGRPGLINNKSGRTIFDALIHAWENDYLPTYPSRGERPNDDNLLLDLLREDLSGNPQYSTADQDAVDAHTYALAQNSEIDRLANEHGIDTKGLTRDGFFNRLADVMSLDELAAEQARMEAPHAALVEDFDRALGDWATEADRDNGVSRTLEDLEDEYRQEDTALAAREGDGSAAGPPSAGPSTREGEEGQGFGSDVTRPAGRDGAEAGNTSSFADLAINAPDAGELTNAPVSTGGLEPDRPTGTAGPVLAQGDGNAAGSGTRSLSDGGRPGRAGDERPDGGAGASGGDASLDGKRGDLFVHTGNASGRPADIAAGSDFDGGSGVFGDGGISADEATAGPVAESHPIDAPVHDPRAAQAAAESVATAPGLDNIRATLPALLPGQQEDVFKTETRFGKPDGYGMLLTNGTGTGKTYSGLGTVKRFARNGRDNTLIVVPDDKVASDWIKSGKNLGLDITQLTSTKDAGRGIVVTTYANLGQNDALASRQWDLIIPDEAHNLMKGADAPVTDALAALRALTYHPDGVLQRVDMENRPLVERIAQLRANAKRLEKAVQHPGVLESLRENDTEVREAVAELNRHRTAMQQQFDAAQGASRPRVLFLSATPFAYEKNIEWAQGYLFTYPKSERSGYNVASGRNEFMMQHFGYRMRFNKLTEPGPDVDRGLMQREFNSYLKREGALSSRVLDVAADYDRRFALIESGLGNRIDQALDYLRERQAMLRSSERGTKASPLELAAWQDIADHIEANFNYLSRMYLLEALKAGGSIPIVRQHLALGRKVVVFHDFKRGGGFNPFAIDGAAKTGHLQPDQKAVYLKALGEFNAQFPDLVKANWNDLKTPIEQYRKAFGDNVLVVNGDEKQRDNLARFLKFQDDASGPQVLLVQSAKNAGWSGHDTTGKNQRVLINLGLPVAPTTAIQQEGRIYRVGQVSDAIFRYLNTGTNWEKFAFASKIAQRASTAENLGMGEDARALKDSFISAFLASDDYTPGHEGEGTGGKALDRMAAEAPTPFARAKSFYWGTEKKTSSTKAREGNDYFATPEPLGLKMVQWADQRGGEAALEPSAGHGAIARWMGDNIAKTFIEPSNELRARLALSADAATSKLAGGAFEDLNIVNKYDTVVMNPPFGVGGKTAIEHLAKAAIHTRDGGRIVALIPTGPSADKRFESWLYGVDDKGRSLHPDLHLVAEVKLPTVTFERAGTAVATRVVVIDKVSDKQAAIQPTVQRDLSDVTTTKALFDRLENMDLPDRLKPKAAEQPTRAAQTSGPSTSTTTAPADAGTLVEHTTQKGKVLRGVIRTDLTQTQAQAIDPYTFRKGGGYFIREAHLSKLPPKPGQAAAPPATPPATDMLGRPIAAATAKPTAEPTIHNDPNQVTMFGGPSAVQAQAARDAQGRGGLTGKGPQAKPDEGLFAPDTSDQKPLFSPRVREDDELDARRMAHSRITSQQALIDDTLKRLREPGITDEGVFKIQQRLQRARAEYATRVADAAQLGVKPGDPFPMPDRKGDVQFSPRVSDEFEEGRAPLYSALTRAVEGVKQDKAAPGQWLATLKNMPGVKPEERAWTGLDDWLGKQPKSVTKAEVLDYLRANQIRVQEVVHGGENPQAVVERTRQAHYDSREQLADTRERVSSALAHTRHQVEINGDRLWDDELLRSLEGGYITPEQVPEDHGLRAASASYVDAYKAAEAAYEAYDNARRYQPTGAVTKFSSYTLPGGENYREMLLTLPVERVDSHYELAQKMFGKRWDELSSAQTDAVLAELDRRAQTPNQAAARSYRSSHWNEPNVVAHMRFSERTAPDGARVLHVEEVQSDWHQEGRRKGYESERKTQLAAAEAERQAALTAYESAKETEAQAKREVLQADDAMQREGSSYQRSVARTDIAFDEAQNIRRRRHEFPTLEAYRAAEAAAIERRDQEMDRHRAEIDAGAQPEFTAWRQAQDRYGAAYTAMRQAEDRYREAVANLDRQRGQTGGGVPDAPFKTTWPMLAMKRMITWAVDHDFDRVAWTQGEAQADRYDLSKTISRIQLHDNSSGGVGRPKMDGPFSGGMLRAYDKNGRGVLNQYIRDPAELPDLIGKEAADKLMGVTPKEVSDAGVGVRERSLNGLELKVGGEGMRGFYDKQLPSEVQKLVGKFGAKVGQSEVEYENPHYDMNDQAGRYNNSDPVLRQPVHSLDITDKLRDAVQSQGLPLFSPKATVRNQEEAEQWTPEEAQAYDNVGRIKNAKSVIQRVKDWFVDRPRKEVQAWLDPYISVKRDDPHGYVALRNANTTSGALQAFMEEGTLRFNGSTYAMASRNGGVIDHLIRPLRGEADKFFWWVAANRAEQLTAEDRENLFTQQDIDVLKRTNQGQLAFDYQLPNGQVTRSREVAYNDSLRKKDIFDHNVLDLATRSGLISDDVQNALIQNPFYVPFYRLADDDGHFAGPSITSGFVKQYAFKTLKGGKEKLNNDLWDNAIKNWAHMIDAALRNRAAAMVLDVAQTNGAVTEVTQAQYDHMGKADRKHTVWIMNDGKKQYFLVDDPMLLTAISALTWKQDDPLMRAAQKFRTTLTAGVTADPRFMLRNFIRDAQQAMAVSPLSLNVFGNVRRGFAQADVGRATMNLARAMILQETKKVRRSDRAADLLAGGGLMNVGAGDTGARQVNVKTILGPNQQPVGIVLDSPDRISAFWHRLRTIAHSWKRVGEESEDIQRYAIYDKLLDEGAPHDYAAFSARDLTDFSLRGAGRLARTITTMVPFLNARLQGLYKVARSAADADRSVAMAVGKRVAWSATKKLAIALAVHTLLGLALDAIYADDEDYKKRSDYDRATYFWFKIGKVQISIPKGFEIAALSQVAINGIQAFFGWNEMTGQRFNEQLWHLLGTNLSMNPTPQFLKPIADLWQNQNFAGTPIVPKGLDQLQPEYRYTQQSTMPARAISDIGNRAGRAVFGQGTQFLSPLQIDYLVQGYFGWLGAQVMNVADLTVRGIDQAQAALRGVKSIEPVRPDTDLWATVTGGMIRTDPSRTSRYVDMLYQQGDAVKEAYATYRMKLASGHPEEAAAFAQKNKDLLVQYGRITSAERTEADLNRAIKQVAESQTLSGEQKRLRIMQYNAQRNRAAENIFGSPRP